MPINKLWYILNRIPYKTNEEVLCDCWNYGSANVYSLYSSITGRIYFTVPLMSSLITSCFDCWDVSRYAQDKKTLLQTQELCYEINAIADYISFLGLQ